MKRALIFGVGGMDGSHLANLLLEKGYSVHGTHRRSSCDNLGRVAHCRDRLTLHRCELTDHASVDNALVEAMPDEVYNMADQDEVGWSKDTPLYSAQVTYGGPATILELLRGRGPTVRFFQPISSTVFGPTAGPQDEGTPLAPRSPYACAKAAAWLLCKHYRREHGVYVSCGVFFNHTSERQPGHYLLPKIARQAVQVARGERDRIELDGPDTAVDVGYAPDYVGVAWRTLQQDAPDDYAVGTGAGVRVSDLCRQALELAGARADRFALHDRTCPDAGNVAATARAANRLGRRGDCYSARWVLAKLVDHYKGQ